jgi:hypothetical protein
MKRHLIIDVRFIESCSVQACQLVTGAFAWFVRLWLVGLSSGVTLSFFTSAKA